MTQLQSLKPYAPAPMAPRVITKTRKPERSTEDAMRDLLFMLEYRRPDGSKHERKFINRFIKPLGDVTVDAAGNLIKRVGKSNVLWSSHTDTVHSSSGTQRLAILGDKIKLRSGETANCLGADCTTGVWIMREMILANVPGLYIFHATEESGGIGSSHIARHSAEILSGMKAAIAFDRKGTKSIITHQAGSRCCSGNFSSSLSKALGGGFEDDSGGTFTDTANYTDYIGECTNISVGYFDQHSSRETQSISAAVALRQKMIAFDENKLTFSRRPGEIDEDDFWHARSGFGFSRHRHWDKKGYTSHYGNDFPGWSQEEHDEGASTGKGHNTYSTLLRMVRNNPEGVADFLEGYGVDADELRDWLMDNQGYIRT